MKNDNEKRFVWIKLYEETGDAGLVCRRCGISRSTLRKWWKPYQTSGFEGLASLNKCPKTSPMAKVGNDESHLILQLHKERNLGARRIQS